MPTSLKWTPELVRQFWNGIAQSRLDELSFSRTSGDLFLDMLGAVLPPGSACLDFGAGDGSLVDKLLARGHSAAAYEPSQGRLGDAMRARFASQERFLGVVGPDDKVTFDVVIAAEVIEHILDGEMDLFLGQIDRFLKPGGVLVVSTPNAEVLEHGMAYCPVCDHMFHRWQHVRSFTAESLAALIGEAGYEHVATHMVDFSHYGVIHKELVQMRKRLAWYRWFGPLFAPFAKLVGRQKGGNLRLGSQNALIYVGRKVLDV